MTVVTQNTEWAGVGSDSESEQEGNSPVIARRASGAYQRRESRLDEAAAARAADSQLMQDREVDVHQAVREWKPSFDEEDDDADSPTMKKVASEAYQRRESRLANVAALAAQGEPRILADREVAVTTQSKPWAGDEDSDDECPVMELIATEVFKRRETRLMDAPALHDDTVFGDTQLEVVHQGKEWAASKDFVDSDDSDSEGEAPVTKRASQMCQRRESRLAGVQEVAQTTQDSEQILGDKEVTVAVQDTKWADDDDSDDDAGVMELVATDLFKRRETRLLEAPDLHDDRVFGDTQLEVMPEKKEWAGAGSDSDSDGDDGEEGPAIQRVATETFKRRESRLEVAAAREQQEDETMLGDREVNLVEQARDWACDVDSDDSDAHGLDLVAQDLYKRRETRLVDAPDLHDDRVFGDLQLDIVKTGQEWKGAGDSSDSDSESDMADVPSESPPNLERRASDLFKRRETRLAHALQAEETILADKEVQLQKQDTDWAGDVDTDDDDNHGFDLVAQDLYKRRETRLLDAPDLHDDRVYGDVQLDVVKQGKEWAQDAESSDDDADEEPAVARVATESFQRRESRLANVPAEGLQMP